MDLESGLSTSVVKSCDCGCNCSSSMNRSLSGTWLRSVKRKIDEGEGEERFSIPGIEIPQVARVDVSYELDALREMVTSQQETIQDLSLELEEERNASSSATNEAMSMILRLQREKAEIQMEARQFKRFAEEKMAHDQEELLAMEDLLYKREEAMQEFCCEMQAYKHRMMSYGVDEVETDGGRWNTDAGFDLNVYDYPLLKCDLNEKEECLNGEDDVCDDVEKYAFDETPRDHLKDLELRIDQLERSPRPIATDGEFASPKDVFEKVIVGHSPSHMRRISNTSVNSFFANDRERGSDSPTDSPNGASFGGKDNSQTSSSNLRNVDTVSETEDDTSDRVYMIDSVHQGVTYNGVEIKPGIGVCDDYVATPRESLGQVELGDSDIKKLYLRLQALEADRESMKQALVSMRTDKAQLVLLKEIAQHLRKEMTPAKRIPVKKPSIVASFSFMSVLKWIWSFIFWRNKARRSRYMFGTSLQKPGLLMLLDKGPRIGQWRCLSRTQM